MNGVLFFLKYSQIVIRCIYYRSKEFQCYVLQIGTENCVCDMTIVYGFLKMTTGLKCSVCKSC